MVKFPLSDDDINNPTTWKEKGNDFFLKGHFEDAIKCYARAIEIDPDYFDAWNNLGLALIKLGKIDEAKKCNDKVKELKLKNKESFIPDTSQNVVSKEDFYPTSPPEKEGFPHPSTNLPVIQTEKEKEVTSSSNIEDEEREYCRNCGEELPYKQGEWPQSLPKICPSCGVRVKDPIRYGSREGQGRTHVEKLKNPLLAALLSIIPGLGQAYNGQILRGLLFFFATGIGLLLLVFPGIIVWIFGIYDSYRTAKKMNYGDIPFKNTSVKLIVGYILLLLILSGVAAAGYSYF
ncbi:MAG TPA: tetratricopeptide repeat protein, partial [Methanoregulaceae archaeon]|nr:tetratricopeptide repeat protein [Methanoregulaceae archaeon]